MSSWSSIGILTGINVVYWRRYVEWLAIVFRSEVGLGQRALVPAGQAYPSYWALWRP
jgi:hypothetical protein